MQFVGERMHKMNVEIHNPKIEERRRKVRSLLAEGNTETEIGKILRVDQSTVSRDITELKEDSRNYIYDLAKTDLAYSYQQCIEEIETVRIKAWEILKREELDVKDQVLLMQLLKDCAESKFSLFEKGPSILNVQSLEDRMSKLEST
jgi:IS30 family transposase